MQVKASFFMQACISPGLARVSKVGRGGREQANPGVSGVSGFRCIPCKSGVPGKSDTPTLNGRAAMPGRADFPDSLLVTLGDSGLLILIGGYFP